MNLPIHPDFTSAINSVQLHLRQSGNHLETESWQGIKKPPEFFEALNVSFAAMIPPIATIALQIKPNLPWADDHFLERIGGRPLNPGEQYKNWPPYKNNPSNDKFRTTGEGQFSHTYMERFWPKDAGINDGNSIEEKIFKTNRGIRYEYGDLNTMIEVMKAEPFTRQAYLPIWFPEDGEAALAGARVPCTLGYHFIRRGDSLHVSYYIRSCDFIRHFRDDIYLCCKLAYHILKILKANDYTKWLNVTPGIFTMHISSLHIFSKEYNFLKD